MTCIAGIARDGVVTLASDTAGVDGYHNLWTRRDTKIFTLRFPQGDVVIGFTTSFRFGQLIRHRLSMPTPPEHHDTGGTVDRWMTVEFVDALRDALRDGGWLEKDKDREESGELLVGIHGRLFRVDAHFGVGESDDEFDAVGCAAQQARGALAVLTDLHADLTAVEILVATLGAAERLSSGVRAPFHFAEAGPK